MAGIVFFENPPEGDPDHFNWHLNGPDDPETFEQWLDVTKPPTDQLGMATGSSVGQLFRDNGGDSINLTLGGAAVSALDNPRITRAFNEDDTIDPSLLFDTNSAHVFFNGADLISDFEEGATLYMGVQTANGNFGWIEVVRDGFNFTSTGWAYETEPGVPINAGQVPVGGTAPILGLGLLFRRSRKRKR